MGIGEALRWALAKLVMRAAGDQAKTACSNLQLCAGLEAGIEGATYAVGQRRLARVRGRREGTEDEAAVEEEEDESGGVVQAITYLSIDMSATKEEAADGLEEALGMEAKKDVGSEGAEGGGGTLRALGSLEFLTQEA